MNETEGKKQSVVYMEDNYGNLAEAIDMDCIMYIDVTQKFMLMKDGTKITFTFENAIMSLAKHFVEYKTGKRL